MPDVIKDETSEVEEIRPGTVIDGKYEIIEVLGKGGMGTVYKTYHKFIHKAMAIKMLNPQLSNAEQIVMRFEREAMASARIEHPHVCRVTDSGRTPDNQLYIVMELLEGRSLQKIIGEEAPLSVARSMSISRQICGALVKAHEMKIIHRDLKPENIMVLKKEDGSEFIKIMDFGIAKVTLDDVPATQLTTAGMVFGTPHYISPEQATGDPIDGRSDLYSLGCMMYEMARGNRPYEADTVGGLLRKHVTGRVPEIQAADKSGPVKLKRLSDLVRRLMAKNPDERPSTAGDVSDILDKIETSEISDDSIATAATIIVEKGEAEFARFASFVKDIFLSLVTLRTTKAGSKARGLFDSILIPFSLKIATWVRKYPVVLAGWCLFVVAALSALSAGVVVLSKVSLDGEEGSIYTAPDKEASELFPLPFPGKSPVGKKTGEIGKSDGKGGEADILPELEKALDLAREEKNREALDILEGFTTNLELMSQPSFLFHLVVLRSKNGKHEEALDAIDRCVKAKKLCGKLPPVQEAMLEAFYDKDTSERASRYIVKYAAGATLAQIEILAREGPKKWLRKAAFDVLKEGNYLKKLEKWSQYSIQFVNATKCKKRKEFLKKIRKTGDPKALPALELFSVRSGCGFLKMGDCYKCFRKEWQKTRSALKAKKDNV